MPHRWALARCTHGVLCAALLLLAGPARADTFLDPCTVDRPGEGWRCNPPRSLALGLALLKEDGFGATVLGRRSRLGLQLGAGYKPYLVFVEDDFRFFNAMQFTGSAIVYLTDDRWPRQYGIKASYFYNTMSGSGLALGYLMEFSYWKRFTIALSGGVQLYLQAGQRLERSLGPEVPLDWTAVVQPYVGLTLHYYLL